MTQKFYKTAEAAEILGVSPADVNRMREQRELHGYRDGADWKFKSEDVDRMAAEMKAGPADGGDEEGSDILLSEAEIGSGESGASGTVIGPSLDAGLSGTSDIKISGGDEQDADEGGSGSQFEELDLALEEDLTLEDSQLASADEDATSEGGSDLDLSEGEELDDDDLVLGGSGSGSDITMGGDSGISLVDPADSGLSLEEPLELAGGADETLELGEDDMISLSEEADLDSPTELKAEEEFTLTPMEEGGDDDDSESGSQVIALDEVDEAEAEVGGAARTPMLDEDFAAAEPDLGMAPVGAGMGAPGMGAPQDFGAGQPMGMEMASLPEAPYTVWNIVALVFCALFLAVAGMMMYDLMRNMWSWGGATTVNSSIMDSILSLFEK
jgi:excisionase family DNA binding protein